MAKNIYPHRLSCGGYENFEEIMISEEKKTETTKTERCFLNPWP